MVIVRAALVSALAISLVTISLSLSQEEALLKLKASITHNGALDSWVSGTSPCKGWHGVVCFEGIIHGLRLSSMSLSGKIDMDALVEISGLRTIGLANNSFSGPIPHFNRLGAIKSLLLSKNNFSGEIPNEFFSQMLSTKKLWLRDNEFSGPIPESLARLSHLRELHLEGNKFSGTIPSIKNATLISLDLSRNDLSGEIPESLSNFNESAFAKNEGLCGKPLNNPCSIVEEEIASEENKEEKNAPKDQNDSAGTKIAALVIVGLLALGLLLIIRVSLPHQKEQHFGGDLNNEVSGRVYNKDNDDLSGAPKNSEMSESGSKKSSRRGSNSGSSRSSGDIVMVNDEKAVFGLPDLMKAAAEVLGNGAMGSAYKAMMANGLSVVVKRIREIDALGKDGFDAEMRRFGKLRHPNILALLAYHYRRDEKLLVSEHVPKGSLLYVLHGERGICHAKLNWPTRYKIILGIARGLGFLHTEFSTYELPHGNLKSSNVLLGENYEPLLSDYAFYPLMSSLQAAQAMFAFKAPESSNGVSPKCDVYSLGIIILEMMTGKFPSQYLSDSKGGTDVVQWAYSAIAEKREEEIIDSAIASSADHSKIEMVGLLHIGVASTESDPEKRLDLREAIRCIEELQV